MTTDTPTRTCELCRSIYPITAAYGVVIRFCGYCRYYLHRVEPPASILKAIHSHETVEELRDGKTDECMDCGLSYERHTKDEVLYRQGWGRCLVCRTYIDFRIAPPRHIQQLRAEIASQQLDPMVRMFDRARQLLDERERAVFDARVRAALE